MTRDEAIDLLIQRDLAQLSPERREVLLLDWWSIDSGDPDYDNLPARLKEALSCNEPPGDPKNSLYDPLLKVALRRQYIGVLNSYLRSQIATLGRDEVVDGEVEELVSCPCCGYISLGERGTYEICRVCFWEDDGTTDLDRVSGPNHMTLRDARLNVQRFGAVTESARHQVLSDGKERYASITI